MVAAGITAARLCWAGAFGIAAGGMPLDFFLGASWPHLLLGLLYACVWLSVEEAGDSPAVAAAGVIVPRAVLPAFLYVLADGRLGAGPASGTEFVLLAVCAALHIIAAARGPPPRQKAPRAPTRASARLRGKREAAGRRNTARPRPPPAGAASD